MSNERQVNLIDVLDVDRHRQTCSSQSKGHIRTFYVHSLRMIKLRLQLSNYPSLHLISTYYILEAPFVGVSNKVVFG